MQLPSDPPVSADPALRDRLRPRRRLLYVGLPASGILLGLAACALPGARPEPPAAPAPAAPRPAPSPPPAPRRPRLGLALGGGAARGFAHIGVIETLEQAGIRPDVVAGTSAGSLVGALYASGMGVRALRETAMQLEEGLIGDWVISLRGVIRGRALQEVVNRRVGGRPIERFAMPFVAVTTDLHDGSPRWLRNGDAGVAVRASSAVPGVFEPVRIGEREYVDGGLVSPVPVRAARALGAEVVIAVDISSKPRFQPTDSIPQVLLQAFSIMGQHLAGPELREADLLISPAVSDRGSADFSDRTGAIQRGALAMRAALPALREKLSAWNPPD